jgi:hypothetical protein
MSLQQTQTRLLRLARRYHPRGLLLAVLLSFGGAGLCGGSLWWLRRRR